MQKLVAFKVTDTEAFAEAVAANTGFENASLREVVRRAVLKTMEHPDNQTEEMQ